MKNPFLHFCVVLFLTVSAIGKDTKAPAPSPKVISAKNDVLLSIEGKPVITVKEFEDSFPVILHELQRTRPEHWSGTNLPIVKREIFDGMVSAAIFNTWIRKKGIDKTTDYQKDSQEQIGVLKKNISDQQKLKIIEKSFQELVDVKYFAQQYPGILITEQDIEQYIKDNAKKVSEKLYTNIDIDGVLFKDLNAALTFYNKIADKKGKALPGITLSQQATKEKLEVQNIKDKRFMHWPNLSDEPEIGKTTIIITPAPLYFVIQIVGKQQKKTELPSFKKLKEDADFNDLINYVTRTIQWDRHQKALAQLKKEFNVKENLSYFDKEKS